MEIKATPVSMAALLYIGDTWAKRTAVQFTHTESVYFVLGNASTANNKSEHTSATKAVNGESGQIMRMKYHTNMGRRAPADYRFNP